MNEQKAQWVVPNPQIPRSFGIMNIVFGSLMLLTAVGFVVYFVLSPTFGKQIQAEVKKQQEDRKSERETKLAQLKSREAAAKTDEEKQAVEDERAILEKEVEPDLSEMNELMGWNIFSDVRLAVFYGTELTASILLNVLMIISGAGLLALKDWARRLALWVSGLKILRWVAMAVVTLVLIVPITVEKSQKVFTQLEAQTKAQSGGKAVVFGVSQMGRAMAVASAVFMVFQAVVASIYPALALWFLTRPAARAACLKEAPSPYPSFSGEPGESW
jgi:hypothetical protein